MANNQCYYSHHKHNTVRKPFYIYSEGSFYVEITAMIILMNEHIYWICACKWKIPWLIVQQKLYTFKMPCLWLQTFSVEFIQLNRADVCHY